MEHGYSCPYELGQEWAGVWSGFSKLPAEKLRERQVWAQTVRRQLLPPVLALAERAGEEQEAAGAQAAAATSAALCDALELRACANPGCTNVQGCSEGRLRGRRCGGCGSLRFCSEACLQQHWPEHAAACTQPSRSGAA